MAASEVVINEAAAREMVDGIENDTVRNLVLFGLAEARMRVLRKAGQEQVDWSDGLPSQPFDMRFFASVLAAMFAKTDIIEALLDGKNLREASGWDV